MMHPHTVGKVGRPLVFFGATGDLAYKCSRPASPSLKSRSTAAYVINRT
jgi:hypothetical protein